MNRAGLNPDHSEVVIDKGTPIGNGSYASVYKAHRNELTCAAKVFHLALFQFDVPGKPNIAVQFEEECETLSKFRHPNIVQFLGMVHDPDTQFPVLLTELMDRSLTSLLEESKELLPFSMQISISHDVALAIAYIHAEGFIHRDISSNNVLMRGHLAKLSDMGVTVFTDSKASSRFTKCPGTEVYMPPDSVREKPAYFQKIDCFSFGVLLIQIITRVYPNPSSRFIDILVTEMSGAVTKCFRPVPEIARRKEHIDMIEKDHPLLELIHKCLNDEESERPVAPVLCRFIMDLKKIEKSEAELNTCKISNALSSDNLVKEVEGEEGEIQRLQSQLESREEEIAMLESQNQDLIVQLESETVRSKNQQGSSSSTSIFSRVGSLFTGGNKKAAAVETPKQEEELQDELQTLQCRISELEAELSEREDLKRDHLEKWDWLENEYQLKCHAAKYSQDKLVKVEEILQEKNDLIKVKDERIEHLMRAQAEVCECKKSTHLGTIGCGVVDSGLKSSKISLLSANEDDSERSTGSDEFCHTEPISFEVTDSPSTYDESIKTGYKAGEDLTASNYVQPLPQKLGSELRKNLSCNISPLEASPEHVKHEDLIRSNNPEQSLRLRPLSLIKKHDDSKTVLLMSPISEFPSVTYAANATKQSYLVSGDHENQDGLGEDKVQYKMAGPPSQQAQSDHYVSQGHGGHIPQGQSGHIPQGQSGHIPQGHGGHIPQGHGGHIPQRHGGHTPQGQSGHIPQGQGGYVLQGHGGHIPQGQSDHVPQGQSGHHLQPSLQENQTFMHQQNEEYYKQASHEQIFPNMQGPQTSTGCRCEICIKRTTYVASNLHHQSANPSSQQMSFRPKNHTAPLEYNSVPQGYSQQRSGTAHMITLPPTQDNFSPHPSNCIPGMNVMSTYGMTGTPHMMPNHGMTGTHHMMPNHGMTGTPHMMPTHGMTGTHHMMPTHGMTGTHHMMPTHGMTGTPHMMPTHGMTGTPHMMPTHGMTGTPHMMPNHGMTGTPHMMPNHGMTGTPHMMPNHGMTGTPHVMPTHGMTGTPHVMPTHGMTGTPHVMPTHGMTGTPHMMPNHGMTGTPHMMPNHGMTGTPHMMPTHGMTDTHGMMGNHHMMPTGMTSTHGTPYMMSAHGMPVIMGTQMTSTPRMTGNPSMISTPGMTGIDYHVDIDGEGRCHCGENSLSIDHAPLKRHVTEPQPVMGASSGNQTPHFRRGIKTQHYHQPSQPQDNPSVYRHSQSQEGGMKCQHQNDTTVHVEHSWPQMATTIHDSSWSTSHQRQQRPLSESRSSSTGQVPMEYCDSQSIADAMQSEDNEEYLAVLIRQQHTDQPFQPWKAIFTVCLRNPCCIEPFLELINREYEESFVASIFVIKFKDGEEKITLRIPREEILEQYYDIITDVDPCEITKGEAHPCTDFQDVTQGYPIRRFLQIRPLSGVNQRILSVSLDLIGTDDKRKFMLTNPLVASRSFNSTSRQQSEEILNSQADINNHPAITRINRHVKEHWTFGSELGVPKDDLHTIIQDQPFNIQSDIITWKIMECWSRKTADPSDKTWNHIIGALKRTKYNALASEVQKLILSEQFS